MSSLPAREEILASLQTASYRGVAGRVQDWGHRSAADLSQGSGRTLEIGTGAGRHFAFTRPVSRYIAIDVSLASLGAARLNAPSFASFAAASADALPFAAGSFSRIVAVYCLEHVAELNLALSEIARVLKPGGELLVSLPTEGGLAWSIGRRLTTKRLAHRMYPGLDYLALVREEHVNTCAHVLRQIGRTFRVTSTRYLPFRFPSIHLNAVVSVRAVHSQF